jgi:carboxymethylenebutenolidase
VEFLITLELEGAIACCGKGIGMKTRSIRVKLRDGEMGAYLAIPDRTPAGAIIAIMEIWGVNDTMRAHAHEFAEAGFVCLVPDLFWRQEPGVELSDHNPEHVKKAFDLYYDFDYDLAVRDMEDTWHYLKKLPECNGKVGAVGYCLGGKLCYLMCCRTDIDCAVAYYGTYIEHHIREVKNLHRPFVLHMAMKDRWVQAEVNDSPRAAAVTQSVGDHPQISRRRPRLRPPRRQDLLQAGGGSRARADGGVFQEAS